MWSARRPTYRWTTWSACPRRSAHLLIGCSTPELHPRTSLLRCCSGEPHSSIKQCSPPHGMPDSPHTPAHSSRHPPEPCTIPCGPPPLPSGTSSASACPQAATAGVSPAKPRAPHTKAGSVTAVRLAPRPQQATRDAFSAAAAPQWLAPEVRSPCAPRETGGKPLDTRDTPLTSGGTPVKTACAQRCFAHCPQAEAGVRAQPPRAQAQTPCAPAPSTGKSGSERGAPA